MSGRRASARARPADAIVVGLHALALLTAAAVPVGALVLTLVRAVHDPDAALFAVNWARWAALLRQTGAVTAVAVLVALGLATSLALLAARTDLPGRRVLLGLALLGASTPVYLWAVFVFALVPIWAVSGSWGWCGVLYGLTATPLVLLLLVRALRETDRALEDTALLDAAPRAVLLRVSLPMTRWPLLAGGLLVLWLVATDFTLSDLVVVRTFTEEVYLAYQLAPRSAVPLITALPVLVACAGLLGLAERCWRDRASHELARFGESPRVFRLGALRVPAGVVCGLLMLAAVAVPIAGLARRLEFGPRLLRGLAEVWPDARSSLLLGAIAATLLTLTALGLAWHATRRDRTAWLTRAACVLLLATPAPVTGITLIELLNREPLAAVYDSPAIVVLAYFVRFLGLAVLLLMPALRRVPVDLVAQARLDGCGAAGLWRHLAWPAGARTVGLVWVIQFVLCLGEVAASKLVVPPAVPLLSVRAFTLLHSGVYHDLAVLALVGAGLVLPPGLILLGGVRQVTRKRAAEPV